MVQLRVAPRIHAFEGCAEFAKEFRIGAGDVILTSGRVYERRFGGLGLEADVVFHERYGRGEPSDEKAEAIFADMRAMAAKSSGGAGYRRVIGIGGGAVMDVAKLCALKEVKPAGGLFMREFPAERARGLVLVPSTCGSGSEATNVSILELKSLGAKLGLADDALYADDAVLIPGLLDGLPYQAFAAASIDALIHAMESSVSPKATPHSKLFGYKAADAIVRGFQAVAAEGEGAIAPRRKDFLFASNYAGVAFGNAGTGAVHALSYPFGAKFHVAHGESNYALFTRVFRRYQAISGGGALGELFSFLAGPLGCAPGGVLDALDGLLGAVMPRKPLSAYGATEADLDAFTANVMEKQGRLMANNFAPLDAAQVRAIYGECL